MKAINFPNMNISRYGVVLLSLLFASCVSDSESGQPGSFDGEAVEVTQEIRFRMLPMQPTTGGDTRANNSKREQGASFTLTYGSDATTRAQNGEADKSAAESKINNAYILQFGGTSSGSVLKALKAISATELSGSSAVTCTFVMTAGIKNRVYVVANCTQTLTEGTTTLGDFESAVALPPSTVLPSTGLPMSACQDIGVGDVLDIFQLRSTLAKLTFKTSAGTLKLKGLPSGYSFNIQAQPNDNAVRPAGMTYDNAGVDLISGTAYYIPENLSGRNRMLVSHVTRALGFAPTHAMYVEVTNGSTVYNMLLGDGSAPDFNIEANCAYAINAIIYGTDAYDLRIGNPITAAPTDLNPGGQTANCYIATAASTWYMFRCDVMGNGATTLLPANMDVAKSVASPIVPSALNPRSASVLWETRNTATAPTKGDVVNNNLYLLKDRILFRAGVTEGNAVIAAHDASSTIIWSWHIWRTNTNPTAAPQTLSPFTATSGTFDANGTATLSGLQILDRNLGALSATAQSDLSAGLNYQWGRKDPFPGAAVLSGDIAMASTISTSAAEWPFTTAGGNSITPGDAVKNPTTFYTNGGDWTSRNDNLWGTPWTSTVIINNGINDNTFNSNRGSKSIYDPCPVGWRMDSGYAFAKASLSTGNTFNKGYSFSILTLGSSWFPASGTRYNGSGSLIGVGTSGNYWTSVSYINNSEHGNNLFFSSDDVVSSVNEYGRSGGHLVRCTQE